MNRGFLVHGDIQDLVGTISRSSDLILVSYLGRVRRCLLALCPCISPCHLLKDPELWEVQTEDGPVDMSCKRVYMFDDTASASGLSCFGGRKDRLVISATVGRRCYST